MSAGHRPRKRFGQNFLHDRHTIDRIVAAIAPRPGDAMVEIGPGRGALTVPLLRACGELEAVEMDRDLIATLQETCAPHGTLRLHQADALTFDVTSCHHGADLRLVGNLPYNISTPLIFHLLDTAHAIRDMHFMLQREVVDRMTAGPGSRIYGRLSVMTQYHCRVERLFTVAPGAFHPVPAVESAIVRLTPHPPGETSAEEAEQLARVVATAFAQRRKTVRKTLRGLLDEAALERCGVNPGSRPEALGLEAFRRLAAEASHP
ncbi:16S rRNA (adenine(1518)-N(6)/adenine(1519)-N(6))-dimethyltransferase RsmA [Aquisalimonas asiatica]|uniref:Ribosomal RNA small subunit methyltransferase A n=1 Tax=Aquisalimonas asiatica TaxID=406100 RepID=A0A1H8VDM0_9GAMM|nr:16S rRNA (adenine(1518)-N(6)/adenine(1519)-N(6))-dimethyltransferase RsmA [Aquisalimonas asiatica]SEP13277.1 16S rRNA (adenine1518-N6/adenine1519-N6)-dimethyltransferase [Aquisalimonas asiatica]